MSVIAILVAALLAACGLSPRDTASATEAPPAACITAAHDDQGMVAASYRSTVGVIQQLPYARGDPQLADHAASEEATVCYIDGHIPKGPPPPSSGTNPPSFDREVLVVIGDQSYPLVLGYQRDIPIQIP
jgi:hypothetical protein